MQAGSVVVWRGEMVGHLMGGFAGGAEGTDGLGQDRAIGLVLDDYGEVVDADGYTVGWAVRSVIRDLAYQPS
jgi:hypothetical protein